MPTSKPFLQFNGELPGSGSIIEHKSVAAVHCVRPPSEHRIVHTHLYLYIIYIYLGMLAPICMYIVYIYIGTWTHGYTTTVYTVYGRRVYDYKEHYYNLQLLT